MTKTLADRPEAGPLAQRDPRQQDERARDDHDRAERQAGAVRDALVEDVPRVEAEPGADLERHARAVQDQAGVELQEAADGAVHGLAAAYATSGIALYGQSCEGGLE
jgi:hypothetical protein